MAETNSEYSTIHKYDGQESPLDFNFLRSHALSLLQKYSGNKWTDFNFHDPGITILEYLCFSITDLAYRTTLFPIEDILTNEVKEIDSVKNSFFLRNKILTTSPVTITDLRHYIIDQLTIDYFMPADLGKSGNQKETFHVHNLWFKPLKANYSDHYVKSKYEVIIQMDSDFYDQVYDIKSNKKNDKAGPIFKKAELAVWNALNNCRNISESFEHVRILERQAIQFEGELKLRPDLQPEETLAAVYNVIVNYLNPHTIFHTESELVEAGMTIDRIYDGPFLDSGFITEEAEDKLTGGMIIDLSEIDKSISALPGITVNKLGASLDGTLQEPRFTLKEYTFPYIKIDKENEQIKVIYDHYKLSISKDLFDIYYNKLRETFSRKSLTNTRKKDVFEVRGNFREIEKYYSIQKYFPGIYRIGIDGIEAEATEVRKSQAKQLKGYLMFFEQLLANYLKQLANIDEIFAPVDQDAVNSIQTYFSQPLYDIPFVSDLLKDFTDPARKSVNWKRFVADSKNSYITALQTISETPIIKFDRKNRSLDFMLARFNLNPDDHPLYLFREIYGARNMDLLKEKIIWKSNILRNVDSFTGNRNKADIVNTTRDKDAPSASNSNKAHIVHTTQDKNNISANNGKKEDHTNQDSNSKGPYTGVCSIIRELLYLKQNENEPITNALFDPANPISIDEIKNQIKETSESNGILRDGKLHFPMQGVEFFKNATDASNFRIERIHVKNTSEGMDDVQVQFKLFQGHEWQAVGHFLNEESAHRVKDDFIKHLTEINIQSEGFYLVEHVLLAPPMDSHVFGFSFEFFYDEANNSSFFFKNKKWVSFNERNCSLEYINNFFINAEGFFEILKSAKAKAKDSKEKKESDIPNVFKKLNEDFEIFDCDKKKCSQIVLHEIGDTTLLLNSINNAYSKCKSKLYPFLTLKIFPKEQHVVYEKIFNNRISIFMPNWPARFQNSSFIHFANRIFKEYLPSYIDLEVHMLDISEMKAFESVYFPWKATLANNPSSLELEAFSNKLLSFIDPYLKK